MASARLREPPRFHVVSAWSPLRYPGPDAEETGLRPPTEPAPVPPARAAPEPPASSPPSAAVEAELAELPEPPQPSTLYNLPALLGRLWSLPGMTAAERPAPVAATPLPAPVPPTPSAIAPAAPSAAPRWTRAWICPNCRLTNAPWSRSCTQCRTIAVPAGA